MCTHLVAVWKRLCDGGEEYSAEFLDHLAGYLLNTGLIDYILGASCHQRSSSKAPTLSASWWWRAYRSEHTDRVWHGITSSQDPRVVDALTRMMTNITNLFDYAGLLHLCNKFQPLPVEDSHLRYAFYWTMSWLCLRLLRVVSIRHATEGQMQVLTEQHDLAKLIVEELEHAGMPDDRPACFRFSLPAAIDNDLGTKLWNILVGPQSTCAEDRKAGWYVILSVARKATLQNAFLRTCFSEHLPRLPAGYFCEGMLEFVRASPFALGENPRDFVLDDEAIVARYGIEHLWRIMLEAQDSGLVAQAISIWPSTSIWKAKPSCRIPPPDTAIKPKFAVADLRSFMSETPQQIEGDSARLRYQSFDGDEQTDIMPLSIGKLNTVSSLLASLRQETGFDNYRVYYQATNCFW
ncbi:uncharacterized protein HRG_08771 [Hirsutella rhossiliensis]|uniref:Uncharacterized protein n=1 Tax=Hirsutella rhossiliensis TaxID=111463 RepID=A0A9P8SFC9_9HYPO|nr:uncharacterized protein HRG_08771 [Hirsutella rhossiliensis]KAH0960616.1 hypothetical protein HRG_08771 [Hirsutella rhossiliensis]